MLDRVQAELRKKNLEAVLVSDMTNVRWLTGFKGSYAQVVVTQDDAIFLTSSIYTLQAKQQVQGIEVDSFASPMSAADLLQKHLDRMNIKRLAFEESVPFGIWAAWTQKFSAIEWVTAESLLTDLRKIKTPEEIARIQRACELADACMDFAMKRVKPGAIEFDIGLEIEFFFRRHGATAGFDPIVVSGANSAKPHGRPSEKPFEVGDFVTFDLGATLDGYNSDITRTVVVGKASDRHREIYQLVLEAESTCCNLLIDGANGKDVDKTARQILDQKGLAKYFGHSLGHGLGCAVHDPGRLHETADEPIRNGQVWTVEPGVYIEDFGGVRIEDDVVVGPQGPRILTKSPKELLELS